ncbi:hypothetical protein NBO_16g0034 [Nosema bombycis CQ1]|uniref:Uncharacterized protein n=1 Tax=Nosema bombycis (strain CQ1 / CVCC 102059) TaxID=578461 RepID=R0MPF2_NOSB1|nr:hypothetical protein NBO_16g0034 [Nosema bombycis CQ1]|eukprot:EOB14748.1 hypothetical protein NBO_16g0034 [Nosema bombycis CQ1]
MPHVNFNLNLTNVLSFQGDPIQVVKQDPSTLLLGVGFSNGIISLVNQNDIFSKSIHSLPILSLDWLVNGKICLSVDSPEIIIYDPLKDNISFIKKESNLKGIRSISPYEILGWYRNGSTEIIDIRENRKGVVFNKKNYGTGGCKVGGKVCKGGNSNGGSNPKKNSIHNPKPINTHYFPCITSANINKINNNLIYTTSVPGTSLNIWDKRYTSRGEFVCTSKQILNSHTLDFEFINGSIIVIDNLGKIYKVSETGEYVGECISKGRMYEGRGNDGGNGVGNKIDTNIYNTSSSCISFNPLFNSLFISNPNGLYSFTNRFTKLLNGPFLGCTGFKEKLFVYTKNEIKEYKIKPYLSPGE